MGNIDSIALISSATLVKMPRCNAPLTVHETATRQMWVWRSHAGAWERGEAALAYARELTLFFSFPRSCVGTRKALEREGSTSCMPLTGVCPWLNSRTFPRRSVGTRRFDFLSAANQRLPLA